MARRAAARPQSQTSCEAARNEARGCLVSTHVTGGPAWQAMRKAGGQAVLSPCALSQVHCCFRRQRPRPPYFHLRGLAACGVWWNSGIEPRSLCDAPRCELRAPSPRGRSAVASRRHYPPRWRLLRGDLWLLRWRRASILAIHEPAAKMYPPKVLHLAVMAARQPSSDIIVATKTAGAFVAQWMNPRR